MPRDPHGEVVANFMFETGGKTACASEEKPSLLPSLRQHSSSDGPPRQRTLQASPGLEEWVVAMGLFSMCMGSSSTIVPTAEGPKTVHERHAAMAAAPSSAAAHADNLVSLLTHAQQIELQQAFKQFDQNGNGTMCAASRCHCRSAGCPRTHKSWLLTLGIANLTCLPPLPRPRGIVRAQ